MSTTSSLKPRVVLDAMGVIYTAADDVAELLVPFIERHGGDVSAVDAAYHPASLGTRSPDDFWAAVGIPAALEDDYLGLFDLTAGLEDFVAGHDNIAALTNDVGRWSAKLRARFGLDGTIGPWIVSGDVGLRKPEVAIYRAAEKAIAAPPGTPLVFLDDRPANLDGARAAGWQTILFDPHRRQSGGDHPIAHSFDDAARLIAAMETSET